MHILYFYVFELSLCMMHTVVVVQLVHLVLSLRLQSGVAYEAGLVLLYKGPRLILNIGPTTLCIYVRKWF